MPTFNRFDILAAYSHFMDCWRWGYLNEAILPGEQQVRDAALRYSAQIGRMKRKWSRQLEQLRYRPGLSDSRMNTLSPNAKAIYMGLVRKHIGVHSTAPDRPITCPFELESCRRLADAIINGTTDELF